MNTLGDNNSFYMPGVEDSNIAVARLGSSACPSSHFKEFSDESLPAETRFILDYDDSSGLCPLALIELWPTAPLDPVLPPDSRSTAPEDSESERSAHDVLIHGKLKADGVILHAAQTARLK